MHKLLISENMYFPSFKSNLFISRLGSKRNIVVPVQLLIITRGNAHKNQLFRACTTNNVSKIKETVKTMS